MWSPILLGFLIVNVLHVDCEIVRNTTSGLVKGNEFPYNGNTVYEFLSIPYAEPPIGDNRFRRPIPVHQWNDTYDATHIRYSCWQKSSPYNMSEDCLFLNIYTSQKILNSTELKPVMIYIHGGGLGSGEGYQMNGTVWTQYGVIMVSINYRLNAFGFLSSDEPNAPENAGLLDQILAIKWVRDNAEHFGGDSKQITIFGESAGSQSVGALIVSPLAKSLFNRAIMQSGAFYFRYYHSSDRSGHLAKARNMSEALGCPTNNTDWLNCWRKIEPKILITNNSIEATLTYGDEVLPNGIEDAFRLKKVNGDVDIIAGTTNGEGIGSANSALKIIRKTSQNVTKEELKEVIFTRFGENKTLAQNVYDYYITNIDESNETALFQSFTDIYSDTFMVCPTYLFARHYAELFAEKKLYFYRLTYKSVRSSCNESWMGVCHADDLPFIFSLPILHRTSYSETDYKFSLMVTEMWSNFAKYGNPMAEPVNTTMSEEVRDWPTFRETNKSDVLPKVMKLSPYDLGWVLINPYHSTCDKLWINYFE